MDAPLIQYARTEDDARGQSLEACWDYELDRRILEEEGWQKFPSKGFDAPQQFAAFLHTLPWNCVAATNPNIFWASFRADIESDARQARYDPAGVVAPVCPPTTR